MPINSREKGSRFEREVVNALREVFNAPKHEIYRTPQSGGHTCMTRTDLTLTGNVLRKFPTAIECKDHKDWHVGRMFNMRKSEEIAWHKQTLYGADDAYETHKLHLLPVLVCGGYKIESWVFVPLNYKYAPNKLKPLVEACAAHDTRVRYTHNGLKWLGILLSDFLTESGKYYQTAK